MGINGDKKRRRVYFMWNKSRNRSPHGFFFGFVSAHVLCVVFGSAWLMVNTLQQMKEDETPSQREQLAQAVLAGEKVDITLQKTYVCGTEEEQKLTKTFSSADQVFQEYQDWELISEKDNHFVFKKLVHDLSPVCKENGYFGLTNEGILTLFEGPPQQQKVIQTFFQINTDKFESSLLKNDLDLLKKGIRIHDIAEYNSILSTYGEYSDENLSFHLMEQISE